LGLILPEDALTSIGERGEAMTAPACGPRFPVRPCPQMREEQAMTLGDRHLAAAAVTRPGPSPGPLGGRVATLTGAAGGLGTAIWRSLQDAGASVVPVDLHGDGCVVADVSTAEGNQRMVAAALEQHGRLDILILNAGAQAMNPIASYLEEHWDRLMDLMVKGPFLAVKFAWPRLTRERGGRIIVTSSTLGLQAVPYKAAYVAAKHAVIGLTKVAALEGAAQGLTANAVAPGWMDTPIVEAQIEQHVSLRGIPARRSSRPWWPSSPGSGLSRPRRSPRSSRSSPAAPHRRSMAPASRSTPAQWPPDHRRAREGPYG
jgi:3-hydroxybutyrate dehydrogenase